MAYQIVIILYTTSVVYVCTIPGVFGIGFYVKTSFFASMLSAYYIPQLHFKTPTGRRGSSKLFLLPVTSRIIFNQDDIKLQLMMQEPRVGRLHRSYKLHLRYMQISTFFKTRACPINATHQSLIQLLFDRVFYGKLWFVPTSPNLFMATNKQHVAP